MSQRKLLLTLLSTVFADHVEFTLQQVLQSCTGAFEIHFPQNNTVDASIRRTLQQLRDQRWISFVDDNGTYRWVTS